MNHSRSIARLVQQTHAAGQQIQQRFIASVGSVSAVRTTRLLSCHSFGNCGRGSSNSNRWQYGSHRFPFASSRDLHSYSFTGREDGERQKKQQHRNLFIQQPDDGGIMICTDRQNRRLFHSSVPNDRAVAIIMGLATLSATAYAGSSAIQSYREWKASQPTEEELEKMKQEEQETQKQQEAQQEAQAQTKAKEEENDDGPRENIFKEWFGVGVGSNYYQGGFEETMTKREAALILGVRESSSAQRIKDAHRRLLVLNHPDTGGSTFVAGKINEAKELLLKGKS